MATFLIHKILYRRIKRGEENYIPRKLPWKCYSREGGAIRKGRRGGLEEDGSILVTD